MGSKLSLTMSTCGQNGNAMKKGPTLTLTNQSTVNKSQSSSVQFSSVQFIDSMPQLNDRMTEQICRQWKRTKRHQGALTIALKLGLEKH